MVEEKIDVCAILCCSSLHLEWRSLSPYLCNRSYACVFSLHCSLHSKTIASFFNLFTVLPSLHDVFQFTGIGLSSLAVASCHGITYKTHASHFDSHCVWSVNDHVEIHGIVLFILLTLDLFVTEIESL